jgi:aubergine-like protein
MVQKGVIGASVLTRYNNRIYRIDDIDWDKSPRSTFTTHRGEEVSITGTIEYLPLIYIISGTGAAIYIAVVVARCNGRW